MVEGPSDVQEPKKKRGRPSKAEMAVRAANNNCTPAGVEHKMILEKKKIKYIIFTILYFCLEIIIIS